MLYNHSSNLAMIGDLSQPTASHGDDLFHSPNLVKKA
jgi:hypothetical protein